MKKPTIRAALRKHIDIVIGLCVLGLLLIAYLVYATFAVRTATPTPITVTSDFSAGTPEFLATLSTLTNSPVQKGGPVQVLNNGNEFEPDLMREIHQASHSINFETYIWNDGKFSREVLAALTDAEHRGVAVRIILDGESGHPPKEPLQAFKDAGGKVAVFHPLVTQPLFIDNRNHRRSIVIDDTTGYTGGIAIADTWLGDGHHKDQWRDQMFKVHGAMAQSLSSAFSGQWLNLTGEVITAAPSQETASTNTFIHILGSSKNENRPVADAFLLTALSAKKSLYITNPYVFPDDALKSVLEAKARSGVDVRILVPGPNTDNNFVRHASQTYYQELLDSGIKIYEYQPTLMHKKTMIADGVWSLIGSANIDNRSAELNDENVMGIVDPALSATLINSFYDDLKSSAQIMPDAWKHRNLFYKVYSWVLSIPLKQY